MLNIDNTDTDLPIVKRMKSSLTKSFNSKKEADIEKAIELANYLVTLNELSQATELLLSAIYLDPYLNEEHLWVINAQGIVLLAYISRIQRSTDTYNKYMDILLEHDLWPRDIGKTKWVKMHINDHAKKIEYALSETHKYKCGVIGQEVLSFMYFNEVLFQYEKPSLSVKFQLSKVPDFFNDSQKLLYKVLTEE